MAKREISNTLKNLKFMQRAAQREEKNKKQEEEKPDGNFFSPATIRKCVVIVEGDPLPGASTGRMSFRSFNPSVDKLNEAAGNVCQSESTDACAASSTASSGRSSSRGNGLSLDGAGCSNTECDGHVKRKQFEASFEPQDRSKSSKAEGDQQSTPNSSEGTFKRPKHDKLDWSVLRPKSQNNRNKRN